MKVPLIQLSRFFEIARIAGLCAVLCFFGGGCVTSSPDGATVVERSKEAAPPWTDEQLNALVVSLSNQEFYSYAYFKDRVLNLPLGIKQAQISALEVSQQALEVLLRGQVHEMVRTKQVKGKYPSPELDRLMVETVKAYHAENAKVRDMYFERLSHDPPLDDGQIKETFRIFVLVQISRKGVPALLGNLGRRLVYSKDSDLRNLGQIMGREPVPALGH